MLPQIGEPYTQDENGNWIAPVEKPYVKNPKWLEWVEAIGGFIFFICFAYAAFMLVITFLFGEFSENSPY